jgi:exopolysaccharide biosynthesis protein
MSAKTAILHSQTTSLKKLPTAVFLSSDRQFGNSAIRQFGNSAIRQSGNQAIRQSGNHTLTLTNRVKPLRGLALSRNILYARQPPRLRVNYTNNLTSLFHTILTVFSFFSFGKTPCNTAFSYINVRSYL